MRWMPETIIVTAALCLAPFGLASASFGASAQTDQVRPMQFAQSATPTPDSSSAQPPSDSSNPTTTPDTVTPPVAPPPVAPTPPARTPAPAPATVAPGAINDVNPTNPSSSPPLAKPSGASNLPGSSTTSPATPNDRSLVRPLNQGNQDNNNALGNTRPSLGSTTPNRNLPGANYYSRPITNSYAQPMTGRVTNNLDVRGSFAPLGQNGRNLTPNSGYGIPNGSRPTHMDARGIQRYN